MAVQAELDRLTACRSARTRRPDAETPARGRDEESAGKAKRPQWGRVLRFDGSGWRFFAPSRLQVE